MLGCHDGIPLLDLKGLLPKEEIQSLIDRIVSRGGMVKNLHGQKNLYYQVNATYYSALGESDEKMLLARAYFLYVLIIFTTFTWFFIRYRRKLKEKERHQIEMLQNEKYKEILQAKISFFTNITHEIRTPLTLIMGSLNRIIKSGEKKLAENENQCIWFELSE